MVSTEREHVAILWGRRLAVLVAFLGLALLPVGALPTTWADDAPEDEEKAPEPPLDTFPELLPFDPSEWITATDYPPIGDARALRTVTNVPLMLVWASYPPTLRTDGPNSNLMQTSQIHGLMYESMLQIHPETEEFIPCLANYWKIETDEEAGTQTFTFRLDPTARWADGSEVTTADVYYTWWHRIQRDRKDPSNRMTYSEGFEVPEILDKYTIRVTTKKLNWRLFLYFGGMAIYPAKYIHIPGDEYLEKYNWEFMPGTGPYVMKPRHLKKGQSLTLTRRHDWWAENEPWAKNTFNFEKVKYLVVRDREMEYQKFKKGDLDLFVVGRAQRWAEEIPGEEIVQKGWVKRRKVYNQSPQGFGGFCFNMRKPPFNDKRVRLAFCHLFNREALMDKLFFNEYEYLNSYFPGRDWGAGDENEFIDYDPDWALELLAEAGYKNRNADGYLVNEKGDVLEVALRYGTQSWERIWIVVQKYYRDAGVKLNLELIDPATILKTISDRQFTIHYQSWGALLFPNPETSWRSDLADKKANNNISGFKNERVDELCRRYNEIFDRAEQKEITREIDRIVYEEHPYALGWYANFARIMFWDKFGHPRTYLTRIGQVLTTDVILTWWFDPAKEKAMETAKEEDLTLEQGEIIVKPWAKPSDEEEAED